jgi:UDP:flavonoid glycosyltransferase YjiC (YdhE family)
MLKKISREMCHCQGKRIGWSGVGVNLKTNTPTPEQVRKAVKEVLSNEHYKLKAQSMQADFAKHDAPTKAAELIEELIGTKQRVL